MNQPKMTDVAKLAGVSTNTVSRVIHHRGYLSEKTIAKVEAAMKTLHYQPNMIAQQLQSHRTKSIGVLVPSVANPFFGELTYQLERNLFSNGFKVFLGNAENDIQKERAYLQQLLARQVDGLIIATHNHQNKIPEYTDINLPLVTIDRYLNETIPNISSDNYAGGKLATETLIERGAKEIIHTDSVESFDKNDYLRNKAYEDVMIANNRQPITYKIKFNATINEKKKLYNKLFDEHPNVDGIFASNDVDAILILEIAQQRGIKIPQDLQIIGYDGAPTTKIMRPELATIVQPIQLIAKTSISVLKHLIDNKHVENKYVLPILLREGSTLKKLTTN
ncbi:LacI family DNA-binding transcriptional regulator [Lactobacillus sp. LL6]|uniref:LacI family DNA-binding transcriptional regulator n=1 Tax=Lactobacillus sp. LL6 TaxID=2596827 RepID=UPI001185ACED|nr:LacI family DNA-binding transcriptional regulator [Lactobacillus sp. LL6]TSO25365.1 LacI family transcriptional regulator [Lactobacillus sp. LL6]